MPFAVYSHSWHAKKNVGRIEPQNVMFSKKNVVNDRAWGLGYSKRDPCAFLFFVMLDLADASVLKQLQWMGSTTEKIDPK